MIGGYFPAATADRLRLLSIYHEETIQGMLQQIIEKWISSTNDKSEDAIIEELAVRAAHEWQRRTQGKKTGKRGQENYLREMEAILKRRKMIPQHIEKFIAALKTQMESEGDVS